MYVCMFVTDSYTRTVTNCVGLFLLVKQEHFTRGRNTWKMGGGSDVENRQANMTPIKILFVSWKIILCRIFWVSFYDHFHGA